MKRNPDDLTLLHRIRFKVRQYAGGVAVDVYDGSDRIGMGKFFFGPITDLAPHKKLIVSPALIEVQKPWRRKGVASAIYRKVESLGYTIHPSSSQTPDGVRLWRGGRWSKRDEVVNSGIMSRWKTEYARTNPGGYENFWIEQNGKVHRSEDEYHVEMASRLTDSDEEWAMKAAFDDGMVRAAMDSSGGHFFFEWSRGDLPTEAQRASIIRLSRSCKSIEWSRYLGGFHHDENANFTKSGSGYPWSAARENPGDATRDRLIEEAIARFGITTRASDAGYVLADGRALDFSSSPGLGKELDHREVVKVLQKFGVKFVDANDGMLKFMRQTGAARFSYFGSREEGSTATIQLESIPTAKQITRLSSLCAMAKATEIFFMESKGNNRAMVVEPSTGGRVRMVLESIR